MQFLPLTSPTQHQALTRCIRDLAQELARAPEPSVIALVQTSSTRRLGSLLRSSSLAPPASPTGGAGAPVVADLADGAHSPSFPSLQRASRVLEASVDLCGRCADVKCVA